MGGAQVLSLTPTTLEHFGPLKGGGGGALGPKITPFFEPRWCPNNIHTHALRAATFRSTHTKSNLGDHLIMISTHVVSHKHMNIMNTVAWTRWPQGLAYKSPLSLRTSFTMVVAAHTPVRG